MQLSMEQTEDYKIVLEKYGKTHFIEKRNGTKVDMTKLKPNESVVWGDGETYHYLLTEKTVPAETIVRQGEVQPMQLPEIDYKELAVQLHNSGLNAHRNYDELGKSMGHWTKFRQEIAKELLERLKISFR